MRGAEIFKFRGTIVDGVDISMIAVKSADDGTEERVCIDGKQRLTSLQRYVLYNAS